MEQHFRAFSGLLSEMGVRKWTVATYFQFLASHGKWMFMKPTIMKRMAGSLTGATFMGSTCKDSSGAQSRSRKATTGRASSKVEEAKDKARIKPRCFGGGAFCLTRNHWDLVGLMSRTILATVLGRAVTRFAC
jgi:hypothetical protein